MEIEVENSELFAAAASQLRLQFRCSVDLSFNAGLFIIHTTRQGNFLQITVDRLWRFLERPLLEGRKLVVWCSNQKGSPGAVNKTIKRTHKAFFEFFILRNFPLLIS